MDRTIATREGERMLKSILAVLVTTLVACAARADDSTTQPAMPPYYVIHMQSLGDGMYDELVKAADLTLEQQRKFVKIENQRTSRTRKRKRPSPTPTPR